MDWPDYLDCVGLPEKECIGTWQSTDHEYPPHMDNGSHFLGIVTYTGNKNTNFKFSIACLLSPEYTQV